MKKPVIRGSQGTNWHLGGYRGGCPPIKKMGVQIFFLLCARGRGGGSGGYRKRAPYKKNGGKKKPSIQGVGGGYRGPPIKKMGVKKKL